MKFKFALSLVALSMLATVGASAAPQTFRSKATTGSMDEFFRLAVTRDCADTKSEPYVKCSKQEITVSDKAGKVYGRFADASIPRNADGTYKVNIANVLVVDENVGGDGARYFVLRFVPQDMSDQVVLGNGGQMFPRYFEVVTDSGLKPLKGMHLAASGAAIKWLDAKKKEVHRKVKAQQADEELRVDTYLEVMADR